MYIRPMCFCFCSCTQHFRGDVPDHVPQATTRSAPTGVRVMNFEVFSSSIADPKSKDCCYEITSSTSWDIQFAFWMSFIIMRCCPGHCSGAALSLSCHSVVTSSSLNFLVRPAASCDFLMHGRSLHKLTFPGEISEHAFEFILSHACLLRGLLWSLNDLHLADSRRSTCWS